MNLQETIRAFLNEGHSQKKLAIDSRLSESSISKILAGNVDPKWSSVQRIFNAMRAERDNESRGQPASLPLDATSAGHSAGVAPPAARRPNLTP